MRVLTIRSVEKIPDELKTEIHYLFGMEHHTDYVFKDRSGSVYSATIHVESTGPVITEIIEGSKKFPDMNLIIDDLDLESNNIVRFKIRNGEITEQLNSSWEWKSP